MSCMSFGLTQGRRESEQVLQELGMDLRTARMPVDGGGDFSMPWVEGKITGVAHEFPLKP